jgi:hypothetical protein
MTAVPTSTDAVQDLVVEYLRKYHRAEDAHKRARKNLADATQRLYTPIGELALMVNEIAFTEGRLAAAELAQRVATLVADPDGKVNAQTTDAVNRAVLQAVYQTLARGADDEWSGRTNDVQRARHDGFRDFASSIDWT